VINDSETPAGGPEPPSRVESRLTRAIRRVVAIIEVIAASGFPSQLLIGAVLVDLGLRPFDEPGNLSLKYVCSVWTLDTVLIAGFVAWRLRAAGENLRDTFLGSRPSLREALLGLGLVPVLFVLVAITLGAIRLFAPSLHNVATNPFEGLIGSAADAWLVGIMAVVSGGMKEEVQRAFILRRFERHLGGAEVGLVVFSVAFGAGHFIQGLDVGIVTTLLGFFWGLLYLRRRSVVASMASHAGFNAGQILQFTLFGLK
jgi:membrane protease YdiL (CAAX protease family)